MSTSAEQILTGMLVVLIFGGGIILLIRGMGRLPKEVVKALDGALPAVDQIIGGKRWRGAESEVLVTDRVDNPHEPGPYCFEQVCRTTGGNWFVLEVDVRYGRAMSVVVRPCSEEEARERIGRFPDVYVSVFGEPASA